MIVRGILLRTVEEQVAGGDSLAINPMLLPNEMELPIRMEFTGEVIATGRVTKDEEGRLVVDAILPDDIPIGTLQFGLGYLEGPEVLVATDIGIINNNSDRGIPPFERIDSDGLH